MSSTKLQSLKRTRPFPRRARTEQTEGDVTDLRMLNGQWAGGTRLIDKKGTHARTVHRPR